MDVFSATGHNGDEETPDCADDVMAIHGCGFSYRRRLS
jgi:hypothetical protein